MNRNPFSNYRKSIIIKDHVKSPHIIVGDYSYYAGYYHGNPFEECVMYLDKLDNDCLPEAIDQLVIGHFCSIATGVKFMMGGTQGHNYNWIASYPLDEFDEIAEGYKGHRLKGNTIIGNDVWLGAECLIMPGIHIGDGAVIAARSVVTKNVGSYEIVGGHPAKLIKKRFTDEDIEKLLQIRWWDWEIARLKCNLKLLRTSDVKTLWCKFKDGSL